MEIPKDQMDESHFSGPWNKWVHLHFILPFLFAFIKNQPFLAKKTFHLKGFKGNTWNWVVVALEKHLENPKTI